MKPTLFALAIAAMLGGFGKLALGQDRNPVYVKVHLADQFRQFYLNPDGVELDIAKKIATKIGDPLFSHFHVWRLAGVSKTDTHRPELLIRLDPKDTLDNWTMTVIVKMQVPQGMFGNGEIPFGPYDVLPQGELNAGSKPSSKKLPDKIVDWFATNFTVGEHIVNQYTGEPLIKFMEKYLPIAVGHVSPANVSTLHPHEGLIYLPYDPYGLSTSSFILKCGGSNLPVRDVVCKGSGRKASSKIGANNVDLIVVADLPDLAGSGYGPCLVYIKELEPNIVELTGLLLANP